MVGRTSLEPSNRAVPGGYTGQGTGQLQRTLAALPAVLHAACMVRAGRVVRPAAARARRRWSLRVLSIAGAWCGRGRTSQLVKAGSLVDFDARLLASMAILLIYSSRAPPRQRRQLCLRHLKRAVGERGVYGRPRAAISGRDGLYTAARHQSGLSSQATPINPARVCAQVRGKCSLDHRDGPRAPRP